VAQASYAATEFNQRHSVISAPDDGWIDMRHGEVGEVVGPGQAIFRLSGRARGWIVRVAVSDRDAIALDPGQAARVRLDVDPEHLITAHVSEIAHSASPQSGTFELELSLDAPPPTLRSGMVAKVELDLPSRAQALVPLSALVRSHGLDADVFVLDGDRAKRTPVRLLFLSGESAAVASGLDGVERVITEGSAQLSDGVLVAVAQ
jgi:RND family efflux transporter MFP subunit